MLPDPDSLRCFLEAARLLNFRAAARSVGLTPAALGQRIRGLEEQLGVQLFQRTTRRVSLTEEGRTMLPAARRALESLRQCAQAARGELGPLPQEVVLGTRHELGMSWLLPMLPALRSRHPGVTFHLYVGSGADLEIRVRTQEIDCAVSSRRFSDPRIDAVRLHSEEYVFVGAPETLAAHPLEQPEDAAHHTIFDTTADLPLFRYWRDSPDGWPRVPFGGVVCMGTIDYIRASVLKGEGVAVLPRYQVQPDLEAGRLVRIQPAIEALQDNFRLIFRTDSPRVGLFHALAETMQEFPLR